MRLMQSMDITLGRLAVGRDGRKRAACMDAERPGMHSHAERGNDQKRWPLHGPQVPVCAGE